MKRMIALVLSLLLLIILLPGCGHSTQPDGKLSIVCTIFPQYDWVREILGDKADGFDLALLLQSKADLHNYQPSVDDIVKVSACDLFIYVGGESDVWSEDVLAQATNPDMVVVNLLEVLGDAAKAEEVKPGMEAEEEEEEAFDEHVWLSLKNAELFCASIADELARLDPDNADTYQANCAAYTAKLSALDLEYQAVAEAAPVKVLLFGDRFPFRYLVDDYGLDYHAAFAGCSAETEASFDTIKFLADKVNELGLRNIMVTESADQSIARTVIETANGDQEIYVMDAMQSVTAADIQNGAAYLSIMESNLAVLEQALM